ncbi:MAG: alpha/beta fold hydrolase [Betaproteobacteria bacterium]
MVNIESTCEILLVRGVRYNVRHWGRPGAPVFFLLHGWMDSSPTFQFVVESLVREWHVIAPDWRGYGASEWLGRPYWFPDYYADLEALLDHYSPGRPARLVGHSMGANIAAGYAGVRPQRVAQLVMIDFLGLMSNAVDEAPRRLQSWLDEVGRNPHLSKYAGQEILAQRFRHANPRLTAARATFLAHEVSCQLPDGRVHLACDPWHKLTSPNLYRVEDSMACWQKITAPVLMVLAEQGFVQQRLGLDSPECRRRLAAFPDLRVVTIADAGHNVQHDQPEQLAAVLEDFLHNS